MQVKHRLQLNAVLSVLAAAIILVVLVFASYQVNRAIEASDIAAQIVTSAFERVTLRNDYMQTGSERARVQWFAKHEQIGQLLKSAAEKFNDPADAKMIAEMIQDQESIGRIFLAIVESKARAENPVQTSELSSETEARLLTQLNMRIYELVLQARGLQQSGREAFFSSLRLAMWGIIGVLILVFAAVIVNSWTMSQSITARIQRLREGTLTIGGGNLDHRIDIRGNDEIAELSSAFDEMTAKLRVSRQEIQGEIAERKLAETSLQEIKEELEIRVRVRTRELSDINDLLQAEIIDRQRAEQALKEERQRFYDVLETLPVYVVLLTEDYHVPFANRFFRERFGESHGRRCYEFLFKRTEPCEICETYTVQKTGKPHHWEWLGPDGRNYDIYDYPFIESDGTRLILEMGIDITEQKQAQTSLMAAKEAVSLERRRMFDVLETLPAMICLLTPDYHVTFANKSFRDRFGESHGRRCYEYCFGKTEPCDFCETYTVLKTGQPYQWEVKSPDGSVISAHDFPFTDTDGSPLILEMDIDITEQRHAQEALKEANVALEQSRHELRKLASELVMAEQRERKRISDVLHDDIAQIMAAIRMRLDVLQGMPSDQKDKQTLMEAKAFLLQSIQQTRSLMNELGNPILFDLGLKAACEALADRMMETSPVRITCDIRDTYKNLSPDMKILLYQVVRELLNNVVKHSQAKTAQVVIDKENEHFKVKVTDDGVGFVPKMPGLPNMEGGYGLYSIRERLMAIDGSLNIESTPEVGTVVTAILPASLD
ncbi:MAG TPA: ATP-binding protein [Syntrophales bacterium]|nr:ATP-binding protein [Syntrophales bacterium]